MQIHVGGQPSSATQGGIYQLFAQAPIRQASGTEAQQLVTRLTALRLGTFDYSDNVKTPVTKKRRQAQQFMVAKSMKRPV